MTSIQPPRFAVAILDSLGASAEFRDAAIGDLTQEYAQRVERDGERPSRHWFYRETLRTAPHLARNWLAGANLKEARRIINVVGISYVLVLMAEILAFFALMTLWTEARAQLGIPRSITPVLSALVTLFMAWMLPVLAGYMAARLDDRTPMISATAVGFAWMLAALGVNIVILIQMANGRMPERQFDLALWMRLLGPLVILAGPVAGGLLRVRQKASSTG